METKKLNTSKDVIDFMQKIKYGSNLVSYESNEAQIQMTKNLEILNQILGVNAIDEVDVLDDDENVIPGIFNVLYRVKGVDIPELSIAEWNIRDLISDVKNGKKPSINKIDERLFKFCKKQAILNGLKFKATIDGCYFTNTKGRESVFDKMDKAYKNGDDSISFSLSEFNINTIRQYSSNLGLIYGKKFQCNNEGGNMTIYFKELTREEKFRKSIQKVINEHYEFLTINTMKIILDNVLPDEDEISKPEVIIGVAEGVSMSEDDWSDIEEQVRLRDLQYEQQNKIDDDDEF